MRKINLKYFKTADHRILRDINEVIVLNVIREQQPISRVGICQVTHLKPGTVSRIIDRFLETGFVYESGTGTSTSSGGRRPVFLHINPTKSYAGAVNIGPSETQVALSDFNGRLLHLQRVPTGSSPTKFLPEVADEIRSLISLTNRQSELSGVGVGLVGLVDTENGVILEGENLSWGDNVEVGRILTGEVGPSLPLYFENAARLSALGEFWFGARHLAEHSDVVFVTVDEGVGTGIIVNGQLYRGSRNGAGEFGHVCIDPAGPRCSCGSHGCLEVFASDPATVRRYLEKIGAQGDSHFSEDARIDVTMIVRLAREGHPAALEAIQETARYIGWGLAPIIYGFNPDAIVIAGKVVEDWSLVEKEIIDACATRVSQPFLGPTEILPSTLHVSPQLMGGIALVLAKNFAAPEII
ncbi:MAG: ROK family transcriptional regulator [Acidobacteriota bacterium]